MGSPASSHMFRSLTYQKPVAAIKQAMGKKIEAVSAKIAEREARIVKTRADHNITDSDLINLLSQAANEANHNNRFMGATSYSLEAAGDDSPRYIAAGVVQNLVTEKSLIEQEKKSVEQLRLIVRNLTPVTQFGDNGEKYTQDFFTLSHDELEYLGF